MDEDQRDEIVGSIIPQEWDGRPYALVRRMKESLSALADHGTRMDSGTMADEADMTITVEGVEYLIRVKVLRTLKHNG